MHPHTNIKITISIDRRDSLGTCEAPLSARVSFKIFCQSREITHLGIIFASTHTFLDSWRLNRRWVDHFLITLPKQMPKTATCGWDVMRKSCTSCVGLGLRLHGLRPRGLEKKFAPRRLYNYTHLSPTPPPVDTNCTLFILPEIKVQYIFFNSPCMLLIKSVH